MSQVVCFDCTGNFCHCTHLAVGKCMVHCLVVSCHWLHTQDCNMQDLGVRFDVISARKTGGVFVSIVLKASSKYMEQAVG